MKSNYKETWHVLHFIITVLFPFWIVIWVARAAINNAHNRRVEHQELMQALLHRSEIPDTMGRTNKASNKPNWKE